MTEFRNTLDFGDDVADGTAVSTALSDNGGDRVVTFTSTSIMRVDRDRPLTPDARSSLLIETASTVTTAGAVVLGNLDTARAYFRFRFTWETLPTNTCLILRFYDTAATSATLFGVQRVSGGGLQWLDKANAVVASTPSTVVLNDPTMIYEATGSVGKGTTATDGHFDITITNAATGAVLYTHSRDNVNTGTVNVKNMHVGKITATGATGFGIKMAVANIALSDVGVPAPFAMWTPKPGKVKVKAATGASNSAGRAVLADLLSRPYADRVWVLNQRGPNAGRLMPAAEYLKHADPDSLYGPTWAFVQAFLAGSELAADEYLVIVPAAWGGTGFTAPDGNGGSRVWLPTAANDANGLYHRANEQIDKALTLGGAGSQLVAIVHNAGSTDGINSNNWGVPNVKETYRGYFLSLIDAWRAKYGNVPIVFMQSRRDLLANETRHRNIDDVVQETTGKKSGGPTRAFTAHADSTSDPAKYAGDSTHFNVAGYDENGANNYAALAVAREFDGSVEITNTIDVAAALLEATEPAPVVSTIDVAAAQVEVAALNNPTIDVISAMVEAGDFVRSIDVGFAAVEALNQWALVLTADGWESATAWVHAGDEWVEPLATYYHNGNAWIPLSSGGGGGGTNPPDPTDPEDNFVLGVTKPTAQNTGLISAESALEVVAGNRTFSTAGEVIRGKRFTGAVTVNAANVLFVDCWFNAPGAQPMIIATGNAVSNLIVRRSKLRPSTFGNSANGIFGKNYTLERCDVSGSIDACSIIGSNSALIDVNVKILGNYLHDLLFTSPNPNHSDNQSHSDTIQVHYGGRNIEVIGNTMPGDVDPTIGDASTPATTNPDGSHAGGNPYLPSFVSLSVFMCSPVSTTSGIENVLISKNWMGGAKAVINWPRDDGVNIRITDNRWTRGTWLGDDFTILMRSSQLATVTGNVWDDTGVPFNARKNG